MFTIRLSSDAYRIMTCERLTPRGDIHMVFTHQRNEDVCTRGRAAFGTGSHAPLR